MSDDAIREEIRRAAGLIAFVGLGGEARELAHALLPHSDAALKAVVSVIIADAAQERGDDYETALIYLFQTLVDDLAQKIRREDTNAQVSAEALRQRLIDYCAEAEAPALPARLVSAIIGVGLDPGDALREALAAAAQRRAIDGSCDPDGFMSELEAFVADVGDVFQAAATIDETICGLPEEQRASFAVACLSADSVGLRDAGLAALLDPAPLARQAAAAALAEQAALGRVSGDSLRRAVVIRGWLPADERPALDAALDAAKEAGVDAAPWPRPARLGGVYVSACDGAGGQTAMLDGKQGRRPMMAALLFNRGAGVADVWATRGRQGRSVNSLVEGARAGVHLIPSSLPFVAKLTRHYLGVAADAGRPPPFSMLNVLETLGIGGVAPDRLDLDRLVQDLTENLPADAADPANAEVWLKAGARWFRDFDFTDGWFDDAAETAALVRQPGLSRAEAARLVLELRLEPRRREWAEILGWTGQALREVERLAELEAAKAAKGKTSSEAAAPSQPVWPAFAVAVRELAAGRPMNRIEAMKAIARNCVNVFNPPVYGAFPTH